MSSIDTTNPDSDQFGECTACGLEGSRDIVVAHDCPEDPKESPASHQPGAHSDGEPVGWLSDSQEDVEILYSSESTEWCRIDARCVVDVEVCL